MDLSKDKKLLELIMYHEGYSSVIYHCTAGYPTLGYGRNMTRKDIKYQTFCTEKEAYKWLQDDVQAVQDALDANLSFWTELPVSAQHALADMCYNLGITRLLKFRKMIAALEAQDFRTAALEARDSRWYRQVKSRGKRIVKMIGGCA